jgi:glycosyltransferase involved in cell wall biosynthesis
LKILCFIDSLQSGGAQKQLVELAIGFKERGHHVTILVYYDFPFFLDLVNNNKLTLCKIHSNNFFIRFFKIRKFIRSGNFNAVLSFLEIPNMIATISGFPFRNWKHIAGERSSSPLILSSKKSFVFRFLHLFTDFVIANSDTNLKMVKKINPFLQNSKLKVIYNLVNVNQTFTNYNSSINNNNNKTKIVIAASYRSCKNLDGLLKALILLPDEYKNKLLIEWYGNFEISNDSKKYINSILHDIEIHNLKEVIILKPHVNNILYHFYNSDFVGLFSHFEGFPNSICEAMSLSKPVICSKVSDVGLILKNNVNGFMCDSYNIDSIKFALINAINSTHIDRLKFGIENKKLSQKYFNRTVVLNSYLNYLNS